MKKHIYNKQMGISYTLQGDYYLPDLSLSDKKTTYWFMGTATLALH